MKRIVCWLMFLTAFTNVSFAVECQGLKRVFSNYGTTQEEVKLELTYQDSKLSKYEGEIDESYFSFTQVDENLTAIISLGPDYTMGTLSKGHFDKEGSYKLTFITPEISYILTCHNNN